MKHNVYSVVDVDANIFAQPWLSTNKATAMRVFGDLANNKDHPIGKHPVSFALFEVGTFDDEKGSFENHTIPINLGLGSGFLPNVK